MLILREKIALNAVICKISFILSLIMESWLIRNVAFYRSFLQFEMIIIFFQLSIKNFIYFTYSVKNTHWQTKLKIQKQVVCLGLARLHLRQIFEMFEGVADNLISELVRDD